MINIELTDQEAQLFLEYQKNRDTFKIMLEAGVFGVRNGQAILSFDPSGTMCDIDIHMKRYKIGKPIIVLSH